MKTIYLKNYNTRIKEAPETFNCSYLGMDGAYKDEGFMRRENGTFCLENEYWEERDALEAQQAEEEAAGTASV